MKNFSIAIILITAVLFSGCKRSYEIVAKFDNVDGLSTKADVAVNGMKVGEVSDMELSTEGVNVVLAIDAKHKIPKESTFIIISRSLIGGKTIEIIPVKSKNHIQEGDTIKGTEYSEGSLNLSSEKLDTLVTTFVKALKRSQSQEKEATSN